MRVVRPYAALPAALIALALLAPVSSAAPVPAGRYALESTGGTFKIGTSTPFEMAIPAGPLGAVDVGADPVAISVPATAIPFGNSSLVTPVATAAVTPAAT